MGEGEAAAAAPSRELLTIDAQLGLLGGAAVAVAVAAVAVDAFAVVLALALVCVGCVGVSPVCGSWGACMYVRAFVCA